MITERKFRNRDLAGKWNKRAVTYPRFSEEKNLFENRVLSLLASEGISFAGKTVLDVGCGTGRFTIRVAKEANQVTGTDISEKMLEILKEDMSAEGLDNIETVCTDWSRFPKGRIWDITMSTLTPAVKRPEDFVKMVQAASEHVVYLGWMDRKECEMVQELYLMHNVKPTKFNYSEELTEWLNENKLAYKVIPMKDSWDRNGPIEPIMERFTDDLADYGVEPDREAIYAKMLEYSEDGKNVAYTTNVDLSLVIISKQ